MEFFSSLGVVAMLAVVYSSVDVLIRNLDGYSYIRAALVLVGLLAAVFDYFLDWTGLTRLVFESYIAGLAVMFLSPIYFFVKALYFILDPMNRTIPHDRDGDM